MPKTENDIVLEDQFLKGGGGPVPQVLVGVGVVSASPPDRLPAVYCRVAGRVVPSSLAWVGRCSLPASPRVASVVRPLPCRAMLAAPRLPRSYRARDRSSR